VIQKPALCSGGWMARLRSSPLRGYRASARRKTLTGHFKFNLPPIHLQVKRCAAAARKQLAILREEREKAAKLPPKNEVHKMRISKRVADGAARFDATSERLRQKRQRKQTNSSPVASALPTTAGGEHGSRRLIGEREHAAATNEEVN
jgi:hypothetical protein